MASIQDDFPLRLLINGEDLTFEMGEGFSFSSTDPGGFEAASFPIPQDLPQIQRGDPVRLECGLETAWEGRVKEMQRSLGNKTLIQCEGYRALLKETSLAEIFVDRDFTHWTDPTLARQKELVESSYRLHTRTTGFDPAGNPAIIHSIQGPWPATEAHPMVESWYDAHGIPIGAVYYEYVAGPTINLADASWFEQIVVADNELGSPNDPSGNFVTKASASGYLSAGTETRTWAALQTLYGAVATTSELEFPFYFKKLAVYGYNYQRKWGIFRNVGDPNSIDPMQIAAFCISTYLPGLELGICTEVPESSFTVRHSVYLTPVPIEQIVSDMAKFAAYHWGVWESLTPLTDNTPRFDFRPSPQTATAWAWRSECEQLDLRENIENLYDSASVTYTEVGGAERSVVVSKPNPTLEEVGLHREVVLPFGTGTKAAAEDWGLVQLDLLADQARTAGSATITDLIHDLSGGDKPAWMLRAGLDRLRVVDLPCRDAWGEHNDLPISRVECSGGSGGLTTSVEFGKGVNLIETLAAQLSANVTAAG